MARQASAATAQAMAARIRFGFRDTVISRPPCRFFLLYAPRMIAAIPPNHDGDALGVLHVRGFPDYIVLLMLE
jgi:hypothetical protein